jgi:small neutral amino acid transporter SnatA (MarC family)
MMRTTVIAFVLCIFASAAAAQCVAQSPATAAARPNPELIKTASAATRPISLPLDDGPPTIGKTSTVAKTDDKNPRHTGSAMLLAALAVMSGIALRRFSARMQ